MTHNNAIIINDTGYVHEFIDGDDTWHVVMIWNYQQVYKNGRRVLVTMADEQGRNAVGLLVLVGKEGRTLIIGQVIPSLTPYIDQSVLLGPMVDGFMSRST